MLWESAVVEGLRVEIVSAPELSATSPIKSAPIVAMRIIIQEANHNGRRLRDRPMNDWEENGGRGRNNKLLAAPRSVFRQPSRDPNAPKAVAYLFRSP